MVWTYPRRSRRLLPKSCQVFDYHALGTGVAPRFADRPSYRDHIAWLQRDWASRAETARGFWRERLSGFVKPSTLDGVQRRAPSGWGPPIGHEALRFRTSRSTSAALRRMREAHGLLPSTFVHAAWAMVLSAFSGETTSCSASAAVPALFGSRRRQDLVADQHRPGSRRCRRPAPPRAAAI
jgi:hypothetical protein